MLIFLAILLFAVALLAFLLFPGRASAAQKELFHHKNLAHRGLHNPKEGVPENSLAAFFAAVQAGYGSELDVQLSADGQVVVFHDDTLDRVTEGTGAVDAYTLAQLQNLHLLGTDHTIPLFSQVLELVAGQAPLIVELKSTKQYPELCQKTLALLRGYQGVYCVESFDPMIVAWFRRNAPDLLRGQLANHARGYRADGTNPWMAFALSRCLGNWLARPQFIAWGCFAPKNAAVKFAQTCGALTVAWTAKDPAKQPQYQAEYDTVIFEGHHPAPNWDK